MVKGVNKQIIEVNNTDSIYFEKAVFYLRAGVRSLPKEVSQREIQRFIAESGYAERRRLNIGRIVIYVAIAAVAAVVVLTLVK